MTTIGELISALFDEYEQRFHDEKLTAVAIQIVLDELLQQRAKGPAQRRGAKS